MLRSKLCAKYTIKTKFEIVEKQRLNNQNICKT